MSKNTQYGYEIQEGLLPNTSCITCLDCMKTSYHQDDIRNLYCGFCKRFHKKVTARTDELVGTAA